MQFMEAPRFLLFTSLFPLPISHRTWCFPKLLDLHDRLPREESRYQSQGTSFLNHRHSQDSDQVIWDSSSDENHFLCLPRFLTKEGKLTKNDKKRKGKSIFRYYQALFFIFFLVMRNKNNPLSRSKFNTLD